MVQKVSTPEFRVSFPAVFEAKLNTLNQKMEYSVVLLFDKKTADLKEMKAAAQTVAVEKFGDKLATIQLRSPFRDGDLDKPGRPEFAGTIFMTVKSKQRPGVVDEACVPMFDGSQFYAGCYARATLNAYAYDQMGNRGVAFGLINLQRLRDGESLTNRVNAEDDFAPITPAADLAEDTPQPASTNIGDLF